VRWNADLGGVLCDDVHDWCLDLGDAGMTKPEALRILKLLSALESWAFSTKNPLPPFVDNELVAAMEVLEEMILKEEK